MVWFSNGKNKMASHHLQTRLKCPVFQWHRYSIQVSVGQNGCYFVKTFENWIGLILILLIDWPFECPTLKCPVLKRFQSLNGHYSDPQCSLIFSDNLTFWGCYLKSGLFEDWFSNGPVFNGNGPNNLKTGLFKIRMFFWVSNCFF